MRCPNKADQYVPKGANYKVVQVPCGSTSIYGSAIFCDSCFIELEKRYPQGWRNTPGDTCRHGNYIGTPSGPDFLCWRCEMGYR